MNHSNPPPLPQRGLIILTPYARSPEVSLQNTASSPSPEVSLPFAPGAAHFRFPVLPLSRWMRISTPLGLQSPLIACYNFEAIRSRSCHIENPLTRCCVRRRCTWGSQAPKSCSSAPGSTPPLCPLAATPSPLTSWTGYPRPPLPHNLH